MKGKPGNWVFKLPSSKLSADGSTTLDNLRAEKKRLEERSGKIPVLLATIQNDVNNTQSDINWLNGLNNRRRKNWEKENGKSVEQALYDGTKKVTDLQAQINSLSAERAKIPEQIALIDRQIDALIKGESTGLSKGLTAGQSKQLGELELQKEQGKIQQEARLQEIELQAAQTRADASKTSGMSQGMKWGLIIGISAAVIITTIILIKRFKAKNAVNIPVS